MKYVMQTFLWIAVLTAIAACHRGDAATPPVNPGADTTGTYTPPADTGSLSYIFPSGTGGYSCFRIPAIIRSSKGSLLAFAEARKNSCSDNGDIDMVVKRSTDEGQHWGGRITVWDDGANTCGNPVPVVDAQTGRIYLLMTWNLGQDNIGAIDNGTSEDTRRVFVTWSDDDGLTWQPPKEITDSVKPPGWGWYATGPCHGIQVRKGPFAGRLVIPCDYIETGTKNGGSHVIWSDDHGATWHRGGAVTADKTNESSVAELSDGRLLLNMRSSYGVRIVSVSDDGGASWSAPQAATALVDPNCEGSLLADDDSTAYRLFFSNPASSSARENMTVKMSTDDGHSWPAAHAVYAGPSAYSDIAMLPGNRVAVVFEAGKDRPYEGIAFTILNPDDFK